MIKLDIEVIRELLEEYKGLDEIRFGLQCDDNKEELEIVEGKMIDIKEKLFNDNLANMLEVGRISKVYEVDAEYNHVLAYAKEEDTYAVYYTENDGIFADTIILTDDKAEAYNVYNQRKNGVNRDFLF